MVYFFSFPLVIVRVLYKWGSVWYNFRSNSIFWFLKSHNWFGNNRSPPLAPLYVYEYQLNSCVLLKQKWMAQVYRWSWGRVVWWWVLFNKNGKTLRKLMKNFANKNLRIVTSDESLRKSSHLLLLAFIVYALRRNSGPSVLTLIVPLIGLFGVWWWDSAWSDCACAWALAWANQKWFWMRKESWVLCCRTG